MEMMDLHAGIEFIIVERVAPLVEIAGLTRADVQEQAGAEISRRVAADVALLDAIRSGNTARGARLAAAHAFDVAAWLLATDDD